MLIRFKVSNFLSFNKIQEFSMISGKSRSKEKHIQNDKETVKLLKFSALFGANAAGKSNLLKAMSYAQFIILKGMTFSSNFYCKINSKNKEEISTFDFEIKIDGRCYSYGFDVLLYKNEIKAEWLYELTEEGEYEIFTRRVHEEVILNENFFDDTETLERLKIYATDIKNQDNVLFLTIMNNNKDNLYIESEENNIIILKKVFNWFEHTLNIISPNRKPVDESYYASEQDLKRINEIISKFGTGISECKIDKINPEELTSKIPIPLLKDVIKFTETNYMKAKKQNGVKARINTFLRIENELYIFEKTNSESLEIKTIRFKHKNNDGEYSFSEESDGTIRLFDLIEILLNNKSDKVYFIDELDRCFHPQLTYKFVDTFLNNEFENNVQLIVTTHESRLLNFDLLRRDEVWFANRENNGPTEIYSLEDYNERFDKKIDKAYLEGRYGGVPIFETIFPIGDDCSEDS